VYGTHRALDAAKEVGAQVSDQKAVFMGKVEK